MRLRTATTALLPSTTLFRSRDPGDWADRGAEFGAAGRSDAVRLGAAFRGLARAGAARMLNRGPAASGGHQPGHRRTPAAVNGRGPASGYATKNIALPACRSC